MRTKRAAYRILLLLCASGCATKGFIRTAVDAERASRIAADSAAASDVVTVRAEAANLQAEVRTLRSDLAALREQFGAKITAMESGVRFAEPLSFPTNTASLDEGATAGLDRFSQVAKKYTNRNAITLHAYPDSAEPTASQRDLAWRRALRVRDRLIEDGFTPSQVLVRGEMLPRNATAEALRGRVTFTFGGELSDSALSAAPPKAPLNVTAPPGADVFVFPELSVASRAELCQKDDRFYLGKADAGGQVDVREYDEHTYFVVAHHNGRVYVRVHPHPTSANHGEPVRMSTASAEDGCARATRSR